MSKITVKLGEFEIPYGEAWLLETALRSSVPLSFLAESHKQIQQQFNHPSHGLERDELLETLWTLFQRGDVVAYCIDSDHDFTPTREQVDAGLVPPVSGTPESPVLLDNGGIRWGEGEYLAYGLSAAGAVRWEQMAEPDWSRYFKDSYPEDDVCEVIAGSRERLEEILAHTRELWNSVPDGPIQRDVLQPWDATHWKTLPVGYRARFREQYAFYPNRGPTPEYRNLIVGLRRWCRSIFDPPENV